MIRRSLFEIVDPQPTPAQEARLWGDFGSACAYCGLTLIQGEKRAHLDHLVPSSAGGRNHVVNRVPACAPCNEGEKRDLDWETFLRKKSAAEEDFEARRARIVAWQAQFEEDDLQLPQVLIEEIKKAEIRAIEAYDSAVAVVRTLKAQSGPAQKRATQVTAGGDGS
ncbi:HNH endonuclease [Myxococcus xanthus]|uniref:HNH endonuclease n=1 Tax=Myxococcus xanthus TaxID=34 RepID=UPI00112610B7|nr:HNH endonuclease [Myxococcus xanthus]